jgi:hypothetical protein
VDAVTRWADDVRARRYPNAEEAYGMPPETLAEVRRRLDP